MLLHRVLILQFAEIVQFVSFLRILFKQTNYNLTDIKPKQIFNF